MPREPILWDGTSFPSIGGAPVWIDQAAHEVCCCNAVLPYRYEECEFELAVDLYRYEECAFELAVDLYRYEECAFDVTPTT